MMEALQEVVECEEEIKDLLLEQQQKQPEGNLEVVEEVDINTIFVGTIKEITENLKELGLKKIPSYKNTQKGDFASKKQAWIQRCLDALQDL